MFEIFVRNILNFGDKERRFLEHKFFGASFELSFVNFEKMRKYNIDSKMAVLDQNLCRFHGSTKKSRFWPYKKRIKWLVLRAIKYMVQTLKDCIKPSWTGKYGKWGENNTLKFFISSGLAFSDACTHAQLKNVFTSHIFHTTLY